MSDLDKNNLPPEPLTAKRLTELLRVQSSAMLVLTAFGIYQLYVRHFVLAAGALLGAVGFAVIVFSFWKLSRVVKSGTIVYAAPPKPEFQMPQIVSIAVVFVLTIFVSVCSAFIFYLVNLYFRTQIGWTVCGVTLLAVWLFIGYCWYRIFTEKPEAKPVLFSEQPEGVWPPAPIMLSDESNKD
jgi:hypothetical protein